MSITEEQIAAFADGELEGAELAEVEAAIAADPELSRKVDAHRALRGKLGAHFDQVLDQPVPEHLTAMLQTQPPAASVISLGAERQKRGLPPFMRGWGAIGTGALAASLVLAVMQPWQAGNAPGGYADTQLAAVLDDQLVADQALDAPTRILVSFEGDAGQFCRAYRSNDVGGIACRDDSGWSIEQEFALDGAQTTEFRQAGSEADVLAAVQDMATGGALDADAEAEAKAGGWR